MPIEVTHAPLLMLSSLIVAIIGSFTALRLTSNLRFVSVKTRKTRVSQGAVALGTSIWSMHFVAMLAVKMPIVISYDPLPTLASALLAVLVVGLAFLSLHFGVRTKLTIFVAGVLTGFGIAGMHYLGMSAISDNVTAYYSPFGVVLAICIGIVAATFALILAYGERSLLNTSIGAVVLGFAMSAMHHTAMYFTKFTENGAESSILAPTLSNEVLALIVMVSSFVLSAMFLLLAVPFRNDIAPLLAQEATSSGQTDAVLPDSSTGQSPAGNVDNIQAIKIPYEQNNVVKYLSVHDIFAVQAEGHYTRIHDGENKLFCPWSMSRLEECLDAAIFIRTHRSFLVNADKVIGIKRSGDKSFCIVGSGVDLEIPVSRSQIANLKIRLQNT